MRSVILIIALNFILSGCGAFERHPKSGYNSYLPAPKSSNPQRPISNRADVRGIETSTRLKQLENALTTPRELEQYSRALPFLRGDEEKIQFLSLDGFESRQRWMTEQRFFERASEIQGRYSEMVKAQDIGLGMTEGLVRKSWGEPESVEVSGHPSFRNFRWKYSKYVSTPDGYKMERKWVYFEGGRVVGWEVE